MFRRDASGKTAARYFSFEGVVADHAADILHPGDAAVKAASGQQAAVDPGDAADKRGGAFRGKGTRNMQVADFGSFRHHAEKALTRPVLMEEHAADGMLFPVKGAGKVGNGGEIRAAEINVGGKLERPPG